MSIQFRDIQDALWQWVVDNVPTGVEVIWANPNIPRPNPPYVFLQITTPLQKVGRDGVFYDSAQDKFFLCGQRTMTLNIQATTTGALADGEDGKFDSQQVMIGLQTATESPVELEKLRSSGIAVQSNPILSDVSALIETGFEHRTSMDVLLGLAQNVEVDVGSIDEVALKGELTNGSTKTVNLTVPES